MNPGKTIFYKRTSSIAVVRRQNLARVQATGYLPFVRCRFQIMKIDTPILSLPIVTSGAQYSHNFPGILINLEPRRCGHAFRAASMLTLIYDKGMVWPG